MEAQENNMIPKILNLAKFGNKKYYLTVEPNIGYPIIYLRKPKHLSQEQFDIICSGVELSITKESINKLQKTSGGFGSSGLK